MARQTLPLFFLFALGAAVLGCSPDVTDLGPSQANPLDSEETKIVTLLNSYRTAHSVGLVTDCASLNVSASAHADDMRDKNYLDDIGKDGSTVRTRSCMAGYPPGCTSTASIAELVARGQDTAESIFNSWETDTGVAPLLIDPSFLVVGVGRSEGDDPNMTLWAADLGSATDPSCTATP